MERSAVNPVNHPLTNHTAICPSCGRIWIAPGLADGDSYQCKDCGASFVVCARARCAGNSEEAIPEEKDPEQQRV
jgi:hypothetical protein